MTRKLFAASVFVGALAALWGPAHAAESHVPPDGAPGGHHAPGSLVLSPGLLELLRAEMREISGGVGSVPLALAMGDWNAIHDTGVKLRDSYIMKKSLTPTQKAELQRVLPEAFRRLDAGFHQRAEQMARAAAAHDAELVVFHYSRLVEGCTLCHGAFAPERFPGLASPAAEGHHH